MGKRLKNETFEQNIQNYRYKFKNVSELAMEMWEL